MKLLIIGNGLAATQLIEALDTRWQIEVFGHEEGGSYNRILLSALLAGDCDATAVRTHPPSWYAERGVVLHDGVIVHAIDPQRREVRSSHGVHRYDALVLATGAAARPLDVPGGERAHGFRDWRDVETLLAAAEPGQPAVVIGGGLLGIEAAWGLHCQGCHVTLLHHGERLLDRQLDPTTAAALAAALRTRGIAIQLQAHTQTVHAQTVELRDGSQLPASLVVAAIGVVPRTELALAAGLHCQRGIVVDDQLRTSQAAIYALGDCAEHRGQCHGLVAPLKAQAVVLAKALMGETAHYDGCLPEARLKVPGLELFACGEWQAGPEESCLELRDPLRGVLRRLLLRQDRLVGAQLLGDLGGSRHYAEFIAAGQDIAPLRHHLMFDPAKAA